ncbi:SHOCT domain-containing protein [Gordonia sp. HY002]|uniref:SHOCT domain-containing protein n=1 Tax=Gordonia zhenghanii TaxID=2911516 RepID=UPI001EF0B8CC|nr:SHOCT domain-containing protein [Gordonia zhenghanii]MCF8571073.1 SHOCT domain-containing protein [Gordonia zhenghanii]MCF8606236.1 SHOCT domain-containing protein [Gordonia zhenghanii]
MAGEEGTSIGLGFGNGGLIDYGDSVEYRQTGKFLPAFRINVADITGFSVRKATRDDKKRLGASGLQQVFVVQGSGTTLAEVAVNHGTADKIEQTLRAHPRFGSSRHQMAPAGPAAAAAAPASWVDELVKLAALRDAGALTPEEFETAKHKLIN